MSIEKIYNECVRQTAEFVHGIGFEDVILGLSGGIDSSLVAAIAVDALGPEHVHGVLLPGPYSSQSSIDDALELSKNLGISTKTVPINDAYEAFAHVLAPVLDGALSGLAAENTQARCRMVCIMAISNARDWMMLNTGNKSEAAMGYSTLYGDTAGAFAPIGGVYKTDVYKLCNWRNDQAAKEGKPSPIPENVILKPPSAELSPNQMDETSIGIDYATLDAILKEHIEGGKDICEIAVLGYPKPQVTMVVKRYESYAFKRALEPPYAII